MQPHAALTKQHAGASRTGIVFDVKRFAIHDGPGIRATVFLKGCPLTCLWCHNPESQQLAAELLFWADRCMGCGDCVAACPAGAVTLVEGRVATNRVRCTGCGACVEVCPADARALVGRSWSVDEVLEAVERDVLFYDESGGGITLSGGEPLAQPDFAASLLSEAKGRRIHTVLDTCGHGEWATLDRVAQETDLFLYDVKHLDDDRHRALTGVSNTLILRNLERLSETGRRIWLRYPVIPGENDGEAEIAALGRLVSRLPSVDAVHVLPFHRGGERKRVGLGLLPFGLPVDGAIPTASAEAAAEALRRRVDVDVQVGG
jgi:pyruvate formate lyase activating enzyme